ncbi:hypothetical protein MPER_12104 [Moniliophthora perniciosa FA553]|nr:hypothetical protein MPER_12104 [Moniliophthora perniciosa FA553]
MKSAESLEGSKEDEGDEDVVDSADPYEQHFGCKPLGLYDSSRSSIDNRLWKTVKSTHGKLGPTIQSIPEGSEPRPSGKVENADFPRFMGDEKVHPRDSLITPFEPYNKRRRVLKNNERLSHAAKASTDPPEDVQDQGFTRPSVLVLLPHVTLH